MTYPVDWKHATVLVISAVVAGAVNAVAGGGTLLTFPSLIWAGQLEIIANATSTVALWPGALSSFWGYRSELGRARRQIILLSVPSFLGGVLGAVLLLKSDNATFAAPVPYLVLLATILFIVQEPISRWQRRRAALEAVSTRDGGGAEQAAPESHGLGERAGAGHWAAVLIFQFMIGVYGGYFGAGIGILMLASYGFLGFTNIHQANAIKNLNGMCINGIAAVLFISRGLVDWKLAALMAAGSIFGGYYGAGTAKRLGQKNVRRIVIMIGFSLTILLLLRHGG